MRFFQLLLGLVITVIAMLSLAHIIKDMSEIQTQVMWSTGLILMAIGSRK